MHNAATINLNYSMLNSDINHYSNVVQEVINSIDDKLSPIEFFLLLSTQPLGNGVMIQLKDSNLELIGVNNSAGNLQCVNLNKIEQSSYWVGKWLQFLMKHDLNFEDKSFDYEILWQDNIIKYNIQPKVTTSDITRKAELAYFGLVLRINSGENFSNLPLTLDSIHAYYIDQKLDKLNIHNKEATQKTKL